MYDQAFRESCLAISAHHSAEEQGLHHYDEEWGLHHHDEERGLHHHDEERGLHHHDEERGLHHHDEERELHHHDEEQELHHHDEERGLHHHDEEWGLHHHDEAMRHSCGIGPCPFIHGSGVSPTKVFLGYLRPLPIDLGHAGFLGNKLAESLTKTRATLPFVDVPLSLTLVIAKIRHIRYAA